MSLKLNLGCGKDIRAGYVNVDLHLGKYGDNVVRSDLSELPWLWGDDEVDEVLMLDFLEHFEYSKTKKILAEVWRILKEDAFVEIQVPDFEECALASIGCVPYNCNSCGYEFVEYVQENAKGCPECKQSNFDISRAAIERLYGGQDYKGNYHYTAFTKNDMRHFLLEAGFGDVGFLKKNENGETYRQNWNMKVRAKKVLLWE